MAALVRRLLGIGTRRDPFTPLERRLLAALFEHLPTRAAELIRQQAEGVNSIQRLAQGKEVNLYRIERGRSVLDYAQPLPMVSPEARLARVLFTVVSRQQPYRVDFVVVHGRLFSLQYSQSPRGIQAEQTEIREVKLLRDPLAAGPTVERQPLEVTDLTGWLAEWARERGANDFAQPLSASERAQLIDGIDSTLPRDYLEIVGQTEGLRIEGWQVLGLARVRSVVLPKANYYILAESSEGVLAVREGETGGNVYFLAFEEHAEPMGQSLRAAIETLIARG